MKNQGAYAAPLAIAKFQNLRFEFFESTEIRFGLQSAVY
jgi:hypothetical protein